MAKRLFCLNCPNNKRSYSLTPCVFITCFLSAGGHAPLCWITAGTAQSEADVNQRDTSELLSVQVPPEFTVALIKD